MGTDQAGMLGRVLEALKEVKSSDYSKAPPLFRLAWRWGIMIPPPLLAGFWFNVIFLGAGYGVLWGLFMALWYLFLTTVLGLVGATVGTPLAIGSVLAGVMFGLIMAIYSRIKASRYDLPTWQSLVDAGHNVL